MNGITARQWIINKLNSVIYTHNLKKLYTSFLEETGSNCTYRSYCKEINRTFNRHNPGHWKKGKKEDDDDFSFKGKQNHIENEVEFIEDDGNTAYANSSSNRIRTVEDLIEACAIDLDVWEIVSKKVKKQDLGVKDKEGYLKWTDGKMEGKLTYGREPVVVPMFHIQLTLQKKVLSNPKFEVIKPVQINFPTNSFIPKLKDVGSLNSALILSDAQMTYRRDVMTGKLYPVHDRGLMLLAVKVAKELQPEKIIYNGDFFDLPDWSDKYISSPEMFQTLQPSLIEFIYWHSLLKKVSPNSEFHYILGNHDARLENAIMRSAAMAYGLYRVDDIEKTSVLSLKNLLAYDNNEIHFGKEYPHGRVWLNDKLMVGHGEVARGKSGATVNNIISDTSYSQVIGHIHRVEIATRTIRERNSIVPIHVASFGTMASIDDGVVPSNRSRHNWQQGFGVEYYNDESYSFPIPVTCIDDTIVFQGEKISIDNNEINVYIAGLVKSSQTESYNY